MSDYLSDKMKTTAINPSLLLVRNQGSNHIDETLASSGYKLNYSSNTKETIDKAVVIQPDIILIDVGRNPEMGIDLCYELRSIGLLQDSFILLLGSHAHDFEIISGLQAGADDYWLKPINTALLNRKINALLRRKWSKVPTEHIALGGDIFVIDRDAYTVRLKGITHVLPKKEFEILWWMSKHPGKLFSRSELINRIWPPHCNISTRTVDVHIKNIRKKLNEEIVQTIKGKGYRLNIS